MNTKEEAGLCLVGDQSYEIYGLSINEWQGLLVWLQHS